MNLAAVDLNLLVALDALLREENVTVAGQRVGLSQPAMSHALARLRELLGDELLVRTGRRMHRTALGHQLMPTVRRLISDLEATLLSRRGFEPSTSQRRFRIAANDHAGAVMLPALFARLRSAAPGVQLDVLPQGDGLPLELATGELEGAIGTFLDVAPPLVDRVLFREGFACVIRRDHPIGRLTLRSYLELDHLVIASPGYGPGVVDFALEARGLARRVAMRVPHFLVAPAIVARTDLVLTLPRRVLAVATDRRLRVTKPPIPLSDFAVQLVWHRRSDSDAGATWLREQIIACARSL
ncbi:MAG: LysR family transcriptional regulator [Kofleriaceae bacterium]|nr:LysR family transcriptional regulator [Kofleriaceae bacterium]